MQISKVTNDHESLWNFLNLLLAIVNLQIEGYLLDYDQSLQTRGYWGDSLSLHSIHLHDITETFGIVFMPQMFFNICVTVLFLRLKIQYLLISQTSVGLWKQLNTFFEEWTKCNLKINHKKCKVVVFSSRKCKSSWYA